MYEVCLGSVGHSLEHTEIMVVGEELLEGDHK